MKRKLICLLAIMLACFSLVACKKNEGEGETAATAQTFENSFCSLPLTSDFKESTEDGFDWCLESKEVAILFSYATKERLTEMGYPEEFTLEEFTVDVIGLDTVINRNNHEGYNTFDYIAKDEEGEETFYYLVGVYEKENKYMIVNFVCEAGDKDKYEAQFKDWAGKVVIK